MTPRRRERQRVMMWHLKLTAMIDHIFSVATRDLKAETEALRVALLEMAIASIRTQEDQTGTMTFVNETLYDIFDAEQDPHHWRRRENAKMIAIYQQTQRDLEEQAH